jgi:hypothetical protein
VLPKRPKQKGSSLFLPLMSMANCYSFSRTLVPKRGEVHSTENQFLHRQNPKCCKPAAYPVMHYFVPRGRACHFHWKIYLSICCNNKKYILLCKKSPQVWASSLYLQCSTFRHQNITITPIVRFEAMVGQFQSYLFSLTLLKVIADKKTRFFKVFFLWSEHYSFPP